ncbi:carbohydrate sulfotransferase 1 [Strongylocentrotus purpuratus]|uniref:Sulfotransferase domain-containing protein n=1 Tax=Strongylocentrotus purpuratus TaxID=7668 RepID=A0A7M7LVU7_STRPU|nr:carbohydrate sulfotransferase 1 [Strongylocentrotus purpuratus]|eukprot:XP_011667051.1 PREDICTED: carbohydrate sulfotransferase 1-like [Strongylocentrotus purpuratus]
MGPTQTSGFTKRSTYIILLVGLFSFVYFCLFLWDDAVIPHFLESKKMMKYGKQYDFTRASNDDSNDSSRAVNTWEFHGSTIKGSTESYPEQHIAIDTLANIVATSGRNAVIEVQNNKDGRFSSDSVSKENTSREFHMPYEKHAISNRKSNVEILRSSLPILDKPASAKRVQIIIVTTKRSGSSFIGELFNSNPEVFYMYEPLFQVTFDVLKHRIDNRQAESLIFLLWNHTLRCNYSTFSQGTKNWLSRGGLNTCQLSGALKSSKLLCPVRKIPDRKVGPIISKLCLDRPYTVLKTIRVNDIKDLRVFLEDPSLNLKIIHLVRDPRAVMNSRRKLKEPNSDLLRRKGPDADEIKDLCEHMARNLQYKDDPPSWLKGKYMLVRFEDVAEDPIEQTQRIYQHVGINIHQDVLGWLKNNTHGNKGQGTGSPFSRTRDTEKVINAWKNSISEEVREEVERKCSHVMNALSYHYD